MFDFETFVGLRYLMAKRERNVLSVITLISISGVAVGVMALIVVLSVMGGFEGDLREKIVGAKAHIVISADSGYLGGWQEILAIAREVDGVVGASPFVEGEVMVNSSANLQGVLLRGIDPETTDEVSNLAENMEEGSLSYLADPEALPQRQSRLYPDPDSLLLQNDPDDPAMTPQEIKEMQASGARASMSFAGSDHGRFAESFLAEVERLGDGKVGSPGLRPVEDSQPDDEAELADRWLKGGASARTMGGLGGTTIGPKTGRKMGKIPGLEADDLGKKKLGGLILGRELMTNLAVFVGHEVNVMSPMGDIGPTGGLPKSRPFLIVGSFYSGMYEYDTKFAYTTLANAQRFLNIGDTVSGIEIKVEEIEESGVVKERLIKALGDTEGVVIKDWRELNGNLFSALLLEKIAMFIILTFIILVASFNIICLLIMIVIEKAKEIAIIKSMGASNGSIMGIFVIQGSVIGVLGTLLGASFGLLLCWAIAGWGIELPADVYYLHQVPVEVRPIEVALVCLSAVVISLLATLPPAILAARLDPVEGLRYQ